MPRILLASSAALARTVNPAVTVECEYGEVVIKGSLYTAAHHQPSGPFQGRHTGGTAPAPCNDPAIPCVTDEDAIVLLSHLDLDSIGGAIRAAFGSHMFVGSRMFDRRAFWNVAEWVDTHGVHWLDPEHDERPRLGAWWAWLDAHRPRPDRENVQDVTDFVERAYTTLLSILFDGPGDDEREIGTPQHQRLMEAGRKFLADEDRLNAESFLGAWTFRDGAVLAVRDGERFTNHLYRLPPESPGLGSDTIAHAVLALNRQYDGITLSVEDNGTGALNARDLVRVIWPDKDDEGQFLAGGHAGIASGPRGRTMTQADLWLAFNALARHLRE